jgi:hypothetical protein
MIIMHVPIITVKQTAVVSILQLTVMMRMLVPLNLVINKQDVNILLFLAMIRTNVLMMDVTLILVVLTVMFHVMIITNAHLILVAQQKVAYIRK